MLIFTNRVIDSAATGPATFSRRFLPDDAALGAASVARAGKGFAVTQVAAPLSDDDVLQRLVPLFAGPRPLLLYLHGNNNTPAACFERCARLEEIYGVEVIGLSWPSEGFTPVGDEPAVSAAAATAADDVGDEDNLASVKEKNRGDSAIQRKIRRYHQAKRNAQDSADALARLLRLLATARLYANAQPISLAAHSLGGHYLQHSLGLPGVTDSLAAQHNIVLLAPCCRSEGHGTWLPRLRPRSRTYVTFNRKDVVLFGAYIADRNELKLGADPGVLVSSPSLRYIDFTGGVVGAGGHGYFVREQGSDMPKWPNRLFGRLFSSNLDLNPNEPPRKVYVQGCRADGLVCSMSNDPQIPWPGQSVFEADAIGLYAP